MKIGFYPKLAIDGLRKNRRMTLPYILTCVGMVMMFYIVTFLHYSDSITTMRGGSTIRMFMGLGSIVIGVFACLFLFYTNAFLMRRRRREFGLYNVLGMGKRNIALILFWETLFVAFIALAGGLTAGIVFSKLAELGMVNIMRLNVDYKLTVSWDSVRATLITFGAIFILLLLNSVRQVHFSGALELMKSENVGEKPPRANWALGLLGVIVLGAAYWLAISVNQPITAMVWFFAAVIMVIIATYLIMISGSVLLCRVLQKNRRWYYTPAHFVSTASMAYRMKRNGAGLASICILATMVLVMISSTSSLFFGSEDALASRYARDLNIDVRLEKVSDCAVETADMLREAVHGAEKKLGVEESDVIEYRCAMVSGLLKDGVLYPDADEAAENGFSYDDVCDVLFMPLEEYNRLNGTDATLAADEVMTVFRRSKYRYNSFTVEDLGKTFHVSDQKAVFPENGLSAATIADTLLVVLPDFANDLAPLEDRKTMNGYRVLSLRWFYDFNLPETMSAEEKLSVYDNLYPLLSEASSATAVRALTVESLEWNREDFYGTYGGLFYLGIVLSIVFLFGAVLIIYYKQISEGYEDQARFDIMRKVGMTKKEIRRSINSQLLTVFYLPLVLAGLHMAFAFPMIRRMLMLFNLTNIGLFAVVTLISYAVFALFYALVYRITSNAYYNIVSEARPE